MNPRARDGSNFSSLDMGGEGVASTDRNQPKDASWMVWTLVGLLGIWVSVIVVSLFAPHMVSGSEQEHLPIAAFTTWLWGVLGTAIYVWGMGRLRRSTDLREAWIGLTSATLAIWGVGAAVAIAAPEFVTGSDPTRIPLAAFLAPIGAVVLTGFAGVVAYEFGRD
jgi:hypothetical protein